MLEEVFDTQLISKPKCPTRSSDLTSLDFFLWSFLKGRVYEKNPLDVSALKSKIKREIDRITEALLSDVFENLKKRVQMCESKMENIFNTLCNRVNNDFITLLVVYNIIFGFSSCFVIYLSDTMLDYL